MPCMLYPTLVLLPHYSELASKDLPSLICPGWNRTHTSHHWGWKRRGWRGPSHTRWLLRIGSWRSRMTSLSYDSWLAFWCQCCCALWACLYSLLLLGMRLQSLLLLGPWLYTSMAAPVLVWCLNGLWNGESGFRLQTNVIFGYLILLAFSIRVWTSTNHQHFYLTINKSTFTSNGERLDQNITNKTLTGMIERLEWCDSGAQFSRSYIHSFCSERGPFDWYLTWTYCLSAISWKSLCWMCRSVVVTGY